MTSGPTYRAALARDLAVYGTRRTGPVAFVEAMVFSPGFLLLVYYRLAARCYRRGKIGRIFGLLLWRHSIRISGCYLSPLSEIGAGLNLPHPTGIVVGEGVRIGTGATLYQNVTLGTRGGAEPGYPVIGDGVIIYPGAVVVGALTVGRGARIGANAFVSRDVAAGATVAGVPAKPTRAAPLAVSGA